MCGILIFNFSQKIGALPKHICRPSQKRATLTEMVSTFIEVLQLKRILSHMEQILSLKSPLRSDPHTEEVNCF